MGKGSHSTSGGAGPASEAAGAQGSATLSRPCQRHYRHQEKEQEGEAEAEAESQGEGYGARR